MLHRAKSLEERQIMKYTREEMREAVEEVLNGTRSVLQATEKYGIPARTLRRYVQHAREVVSEMAEQDHYHLEMVSPRGSQECLPTEVEELLKNFVADAYNIGVPRSRSQLAIDIQEYVHQEKIQVSFMNEKPGRNFFERFCKNEDGSVMKLMHPNDVTNFMIRQVQPQKWMKHVKSYLKNANGDLLRDKKCLFRMESQAFKTYPEPCRHITALVIYNGLGEVCKWIVVTDGTFDMEEYSLQHSQDVMMLKTDDGALSRITLRTAFILIKRIMREIGSEERALVYLDQFLAQELTLSVWCYCVKNNLYPMAIPRSVCVSERNLGLGAMARYSSEMVFLMHQRFIGIQMALTEMNFMFLHSEIVGKFKFGQIGTESMRILKMQMAVGRSLRQMPDECDAMTGDNDIPVHPVGAQQSGGSKTLKRKSTGTSPNNVKRSVSAVLQQGASGSGLQKVVPVVSTREVATQTEQLCSESDEDDPVLSANLVELRQKYMCDMLRPEEFDSEVEVQT